MRWRRWVAALKATLVLHVLLLGLLAWGLALYGGWRLHLGSYGVSLLSDPAGRAFVLIDHRQSGWLVGYDPAEARLRAWRGPVVVQ
ncbi:MAG TPA: hypothetical protein VNO81_03715 [Candidatus Nitrosotenuis sp.]|nr:hypothetical protein [Candidatus Nitrosotenuis sp.]